MFDCDPGACIIYEIGGQCFIVILPEACITQDGLSMFHCDPGACNNKMGDLVAFIIWDEWSMFQCNPGACIQHFLFLIWFKTFKT